jgi:hypothetical protein
MRRKVVLTSWTDCYCLLLFCVILYVKHIVKTFLSASICSFCVNISCSFRAGMRREAARRRQHHLQLPWPPSPPHYQVSSLFFTSQFLCITLMRIQIQLFTLMRIWIRIQLFINVLGIFDHWYVTVDPPGLHFSLQASSVHVFGLIF